MEGNLTNTSVPVDIVSRSWVWILEAVTIQLLRYLPPCTRLVLNFGLLFVAESIFINWGVELSFDV